MAKLKEVQEKKKTTRSRKPRASKTDGAVQKKCVDMKKVTFTPNGIAKELGLDDRDVVSASELIAHIKEYASKKK